MHCAPLTGEFHRDCRSAPRRREYGIAHAKKASHQKNSLDLRLTKIGPLLGRRRSQPIHHPHDAPACRSIQAITNRLLFLAGHFHSQSSDESNKPFFAPDGQRSNAEGLPKDFAKITFLKGGDRGLLCGVAKRQIERENGAPGRIGRAVDLVLMSLGNIG